MKRNPLSRYYFKHTYFCFCLKRSKARGIILVVVGRGEKGNAASEAKISAPSIVIEKKVHRHSEKCTEMIKGILGDLGKVMAASSPNTNLILLLFLNVEPSTGLSLLKNKNLSC